MTVHGKLKDFSWGFFEAIFGGFLAVNLGRIFCTLFDSNLQEIQKLAIVL